MPFLVLQRQGEEDNARAHPVDVLNDVEEVRRLGEGEFAIYEMKGDFPPTLKQVKHLSQKTSLRVKEVK